jgi:hypothetical protein
MTAPDGRDCVSCCRRYQWQQETSTSRKYLLAVWAQAVLLASPVASGAVLGRLACYGGRACAGAYRDALGVHFGRLGHQDLQDAVLG